MYVFTDYKYKVYKTSFDLIYVQYIENEAKKIAGINTSPEAEFSVSICSTQKFICSSDDGVPKLLVLENDTSYKRKHLQKQDDVIIISD